jgi:hypothetical protein
MGMEKAISDATKAGLKISEGIVKKAWTILEAAAEKQRPSEYLSRDGITKIQGEPKSDA